MARWSKSDKARIELRRAKVQQLSVRGLGLYEIIDRLVDDGIINPDTKQPYSIATISRDLTELEKRWKKRALADRDEHRARQLSELRSARREAWACGDYDAVRRSLQAEMDLLGTKAPERQEITGADGGPIEHQHVTLEEILESLPGDFRRDVLQNLDRAVRD